MCDITDVCRLAVLIHLLIHYSVFNLSSSQKTSLFFIVFADELEHEPQFICHKTKSFLNLDRTVDASHRYCLKTLAMDIIGVFIRYQSSCLVEGEQATKSHLWMVEGLMFW